MLQSVPPGASQSAVIGARGARRVPAGRQPEAYTEDSSTRTRELRPHANCARLEPPLVRKKRKSPPVCQWLVVCIGQRDVGRSAVAAQMPRTASVTQHLGDGCAYHQSKRCGSSCIQQPYPRSVVERAMTLDEGAEAFNKPAPARRPFRKSDEALKTGPRFKNGSKLLSTCRSSDMGRLIRACLY